MTRTLLTCLCLLLTTTHALAGDPECPTNMSGTRGDDRPLTCSCDADSMKVDDSVWGTDVYTDDSNVCLAALHSGLLDEKGGTVTVAPMDGCTSYTGSNRNGVVTKDYGNWQRSFVFPEAGSHKCAETSTLSSATIDTC